MKPTWGNVYWPLWALVTFLGFIIPEAYAHATDLKNTLSWYVWDFEKLHRGQPFWAWTAPHYLFTGIYAVIASWSFFHLCLGIFR